jgi:molybdopterin-guanine dinucleotide biosynthesis protein A/rhodanese-related sulfurtransferase
VSVAFEAFVLTGGASRRFGSDKAVAAFGLASMGDRVVRALREAGAESVRTVGGLDRGFGVPHIDDDFPGEGPLGGAVTALARATYDVIFLAACDLPALDSATVDAVLAGFVDGAGDAAVAFTNRVEPLCAAFRVSACRPSFEQAFADGDRSLLGALKRVRVVSVIVPDWNRLRNVNTHEEHAAALAFAAMSVNEISVDELAARLNDGATVYDVREPNEWEEVRVPGAILIPLGSVPDSLDAFPADGEVLVICRSGARSMRACEWLAEQGRTPINIAGGTLAWIARGFQTDEGAGAL